MAEYNSAAGIVCVLCVVGLEVFVSSRYHKPMLLCERLDDSAKQQLEIGDWKLEMECQILDGGQYCVRSWSIGCIQVL